MPVVATYKYQSANGVVEFYKDRIEPGREKKKDFFIYRKGANGEQINGLLEETPRPLFNLPEIAKSPEAFVVEGERDCLTLSSIGLVATTPFDGSAGKWTQEYTDSLAGKTVFILGDNDDPGRAKVDVIYSAIKDHCKAYVVKIPDQFKDVSEYLEGGNKPEDLNKLIELSKLSENSPVAKMQKLVRRKANLTAIESEKLVLGSVMSGRTPYGEIDHLLGEDFSAESHRLIFEAIKTLSKTTVDRAAVGQYLEDHDQLEKAGGLSGLLDMTEDLPTAYNVEIHTEMIQKRASDRRLLKDLCRAAEDLVVGEESDSVRQRVSVSVNDNASLKSALQTSSVADIVGDIQEFLKPRAMGISCKPLGSLMRDCYGLHGGGLTVIGARPGFGKTSLANSICAYSAAAGNETEILSMEVSNADCIVKIACSAAKVSYLNVISGNMSPAQKGRLYDTINKLSRLPLRVDDRTDWTIPKLRSHLKKRKASGKPLKLLCLDYVQLFSGNGTKNQRRDLEISEITRGLKCLTTEFDMHVLLLSQLSRDHEKQGAMPRLSDLRDSGGIESDASMVWLLWQDLARDSDENPERRSKIIMAKHRNGRIGEYDMVFSKPFSFFFEEGAIDRLDYLRLLS